MSEAATRARPGRPSTGARERILAAGLETLLADGYAGLTTAKVAVRAGENKALITYHFGSKQGLVAATARELGDRITVEVLTGLEDATSVRRLVSGVFDGIWRVLERDARLARAYFDLAAVSVVEDEVRQILREIKERWRAVLSGLLREAGVPASRVPAAAVFLTVGNEGLALEWIERGGETPELARARKLFESAAVAALAG